MERCMLIIDDSEDDILLTKMVLAKIGRSVKADTALNGEAGLAHSVAQQRYLR